MSINIKKKLLKKFPEEKFPLCEKGSHLSFLNADELIHDACGFLKTFYRGCYDAYVTRVGYKTIFICIENFAKVLKELVKAVFLREVITIRFNEDFKNLYMDLEFNTAFVSDELREQIKDLANRGGFDIEFSERLARIKIRYIQNAVPYVNALSLRIVYRTMRNIFSPRRF